MYRESYKINGVKKDIVQYDDGYYYIHMYAKGTDDLITRVYGPYDTEYDAYMDLTVWGEPNPVIEFIYEEGAS